MVPVPAEPSRVRFRDRNQRCEVIAEENSRAEIRVKLRKRPYFLREAAEQGFTLPPTHTLYTYCDAGARLVANDNRSAPSFRHPLTETTGQDAQKEASS